MSWGRNVKASPKSGDLTTFIDEGSQIEGKYTFDGTVMMNGHFSGEIHTKDTLIVGEKGVVNASIRAGTVVISGEVVGNVLATQREPRLRRPSSSSRKACSSRATAR